MRPKVTLHLPMTLEEVGKFLVLADECWPQAFVGTPSDDDGGREDAMVLEIFDPKDLLEEEEEG